MSDDLTIAYMMGVEDMRSRLHKQADEIERLRAENEKFFKQAEMNARLLTENASLRAENVQLLLELDMQQATILVPSQKDDQRRIERLNSALAEALDEAAALRAENEKLREALIGLYKPVFENPVEVGSTLDLALRAAAAAIRESGE